MFMRCKECSYKQKGWFKSRPNDWVCIATKEPFIVHDLEANCSQYPGDVILTEATKSSKSCYMNTAEMWLKAQKDGKIYECIDGDIAYSKQYGLTDKYNFTYPWGLENWKDLGYRGIDDLLNSMWQEMKNVMSIEEAEERFGIKIIFDK